MIRAPGAVREEEGQSILFQPYKRFGGMGVWVLNFSTRKSITMNLITVKINDRSIYTETLLRANYQICF